MMTDIDYVLRFWFWTLLLFGAFLFLEELCGPVVHRHLARQRRGREQREQRLADRIKHRVLRHLYSNHHPTNGSMVGAPRHRQHRRNNRNCNDLFSGLSNGGNTDHPRKESERNPFGAPQHAPFGAPAAGAFRAPAPGAFGAPAAPAFGAPGAFGAPFGSPTPGAFGAPAVGAFGARAPGAFGAPTGGAFAAAPFGSPAGGGGGGGFGGGLGSFGGGGAGLFGPPAAASYGAPALGFFGAPAAGAFGAAGGGFGAPAAGGGSGAPLWLRRSCVHVYFQKLLKEGKLGANPEKADTAKVNKIFDEYHSAGGDAGVTLLFTRLENKYGVPVG